MQLYLVVNVVIALSLVGCATAARDLPHDLSAVPPIERVLSQPQGAYELARTCQDIGQEISTIEAALADIERRIADARPSNQAVGYISAVLFAPAIVAANQQSDERKHYDDLHARRDWLALVKAAKPCI